MLAIALIITLGIAAEWFAWRIGLPSILLLLVAGFVAGPITGLLDPDAILGDLLFPIVSVSVAIILFEGGASLRLTELRQVGRVVGRLVTIGTLITWALGTIAARYLLHLDPGPSLLLGAILVVTGPTVIVPLLRQMRPTATVGNALKWEGILIDPIGAVLAVLVFEALAAGGLAEWEVAAVGLLETIVVGLALAGLGAGLLIWLMDRRWVPEYLQSPLALVAVVAAFAASNTLQAESGLLTVTLMGMVMANQRAVEVRHIIEFKENLRVLLISALFIILAARLPLESLTGIGVAEAMFIAALILVVRPIAVGLSTQGAGLGWRERAVLAWVAPRGIVAAAVSSLFAIELHEAGYAGAEAIATITFAVIIATVVIYGLTATPLARWLGLSQPDPQGVLFVGAHPWARTIATGLKAQGFAVRLVDTNRQNVVECRLAGLPADYGSALTEGALDGIDLDGIGHLLAITANDEVNSLSGLNFSEVLGSDHIYQLPPEDLGSASDVGRHLRSRFLFDPRASYWRLTARFDSGWEVRTTPLTEEFGWDAYRTEHPDAIPLFVIRDPGKLTVLAADEWSAPEPGQRLVAIVEGESVSSPPRS